MPSRSGQHAPPRSRAGASSYARTVGLVRVAALPGEHRGRRPRRQRRPHPWRLDEAEDAECDLAVFPELAITGYPPEDLLLKPGFVDDNRRALERVAARTDRCAAAVGFVDVSRDLHNAAAICVEGEVVGVYHKRLLPNYAVFDEQRYFAPGRGSPWCCTRWPACAWACRSARTPGARRGPSPRLAAGGAQLIVNLNASPYYAGRLDERERMLATRAADASCPIVYVNLVGGQDELVFDGASCVVDAEGQVVARAPQFEEAGDRDVDVRPSTASGCSTPGAGPRRPAARDRRVREAPRPPPAGEPLCVEPLRRRHEVYEALVLGTRDYVRKNGFSDVVIGLSGGVDSSLVAADRGRRARGRPGARRVHAVAVLHRGLEDRRRRRWPSGWASTCAPSRSKTPTRRSCRCCPVVRRAASPTSPRRTCRAASGAWSSWRCRTSSGGWC